MPVIEIKTAFKGRKGTKSAIAAANTLSDLVILTKEIVDAVDPEPLHYEEELVVGGGGTVRGPAYRIEVRVKDKSGRERKAKVKAVLLEGEKVPILGIEALEKLRILLNVPEGTFELG